MPGLSESQIDQFTDEGYLVLDDVLDPRQDLDPVVEEYTVLMHRLARDLLDAGRISSTYSDLPFAERLTRIQFETGDSYHQHFDIALPKRGVAEQTPISVGPAVFSLLRNNTLLDLVESLIGPEIFANPIQHVRLRQPVASVPGAPADENAGVVPDWFHQDNAFMMPEADATEMVTVWLPLADAGVENGCLAVVPFSHRDGLMLHCNPGVTIPPQLTRVGEAVPVPAAGWCAADASPDAPWPAPQPQRHRSLEFRSALQPRRPTERPRGAAGLHCAQPDAAGNRDPRPRRMGRSLAPDPCHPGRAARSRLRTVVYRRARMRLR